MTNAVQKLLLRRREVLQLTGLKSTTLFELIRKGAFPGPVQLAARCVAWRSGEVQAWIESRPIARVRSADGRRLQARSA